MAFFTGRFILISVFAWSTLYKPMARNSERPLPAEAV